ncbi:MAG: START domain-containing protein [archaeon]|nr:START domain-containing protein [archaeon]
MDYQRFVLAQHDLKYVCCFISLFSLDLIPSLFIFSRYRKEWDQHTISCETIEENAEDQSSTIYWLVKYPWPLANRDYVFRQRLRLSADHQRYVACKRACAHPSKKAHSSPVRVVTYRCDVLAQSTEDGGVRYCTLYSDDPGGSIPSSIVNWAIKTAVPKYFDDIPGIVSKWQGHV